MDLDLKNSFIASRHTNNDMSIGNIKAQSIKVETDTFESKMNTVRQNAERDKPKSENAARESHKNSTDAKRARSRDERDAGKRTNDAIKESAERGNNKQVRQDESKTDTEAVKKTNTEHQTAESEKAEGQLKTDVNAVMDDVPLLTEEQQQALVQGIADIVGVTAEQVANALEKLNIKPEQLTEPESINKFLIEVKGLNEAAELLKVDNVMGMHEQIKNAVNGAVNNAANSLVEHSNMTEHMSIAADKDVLTNGTEVNMQHESVDIAQQNIEGENIHTEAEKTNAYENKGDKSTQAADSEVTETTDGLPETDGMKNGISADENANNENGRQLNSNQNSGGSQTEQRGDGAAQQAAHPRMEADTAVESAQGLKDEVESPVIIQQGNETVVEVGGKTISKTAQPQVSREAADVINQIAEKMKIDFKPNVTEIKINLRPDDLGNVTVKIASASGVITAEIVTENSKVKELVEQNINSLREALKEQGVDVGELSVSVGQQESEERMRQFVREQERSKARMSQIISKIAAEEQEAINYVTEEDVTGSTVSYSV